MSRIYTFSEVVDIDIEDNGDGTVSIYYTVAELSSHLSSVAIKVCEISYNQSSSTTIILPRSSHDDNVINYHHIYISKLCLPNERLSSACIYVSTNVPNGSVCSSKVESNYMKLEREACESNISLDGDRFLSLKLKIEYAHSHAIYTSIAPARR